MWPSHFRYCTVVTNRRRTQQRCQQRTVLGPSESTSKLHCQQREHHAKTQNILISGHNTSHLRCDVTILLATPEWSADLPNALPGDSRSDEPGTARVKVKSAVAGLTSGA